MLNHLAFQNIPIMAYLLIINMCSIIIQTVCLILCITALLRTQFAQAGIARAITEHAQ